MAALRDSNAGTCHSHVRFFPLVVDSDADLLLKEINELDFDFALSTYGPPSTTNAPSSQGPPEVLEE